MKTVPTAVRILAILHFLLFVYLAFVNPDAFLLDDAYYSLTIAANIANGQGITYGGFPTNGFQPLYSFLMVPVFILFGADRALSLQIAFLFLGLCSAASLLLLYRIAFRSAGKAAAFLAVLMAALSTNLLSHAGSGLETALHGLLFLMVADFYNRRRKELTFKHSVLLGILLGITAYARMDACFLFLAVGIDRFWVHRKATANAIRENLAIFVPAMILLAPWLLWSLATFGTLTQSSGAFHHWRGTVTQQVDSSLPGFLLFAVVKLISLAVKLPLEPLTGLGPLASIPSKLWLGEERIRSNFAMELGANNPMALVALSVPAMVAAALLLFYGRSGLKRVKESAPLAWIGWALLGAGLYYPLYLINYSMRHFYGFSLLMAIPVAALLTGLLGIDREGPVFSSRRNSILLALLVVALFRCGPMNPLLPGKNEYGFSKIAQIRATIPPGSSIGYTDCGFYGYYLPEYTIVNLDGILNFDALKALKQNRMSEYLAANGVQYVLVLHNLKHDYKQQFESDIRPVLAKTDGSDFIYRVIPPAE